MVRAIVKIVADMQGMMFADRCVAGLAVADREVAEKCRRALASGNYAAIPTAARAAKPDNLPVFDDMVARHQTIPFFSNLPFWPLGIERCTYLLFPLLQFS